MELTRFYYTKKTNQLGVTMFSKIESIKYLKKSNIESIGHNCDKIQNTYWMTLEINQCEIRKIKAYVI